MSLGFGRVGAAAGLGSRSAGSRSGELEQLSFTEVVFEVGDERYPLCRLTAPPSSSNAILRVVDAGRASGRFRTIITYYGSDAEVAQVERELRAHRTGGEVVVLSQAPGLVTIRTDAPTDDAGSATVRLLGVLRMLDSFGADAIIEPFLIRRGRIRARVLVPRRLDAQRVLATLQDVQRSSGFVDFRVVRVTPMAASRYVDMLRRVLSPEQEELLRLAAGMGYYDTPKGSTLEGIAARVGLSVSPVHKRLKAIEELLVCTHVEGTSTIGTPAKRRRGARIAPRIPETAPCEVALRVRWPDSRISRFTASLPGSRALVQVLGHERGAPAQLLLVVIAPEADYERLLSEFRARLDVIDMETVDRDRSHCSVKITLELATQAGATFPWWTEVWGEDAVARPFVFEGEDVTVRMLLMRPMPDQEVRSRLDRAAKLGGWAEHELMAARSPDELRIPGAPAEPPTSRQEEVLKIAHALGYYRTPRACTLEQVAATLGVSANAIHKNLSSAESKVIASYLSAGL